MSNNHKLPVFKERVLSLMGLEERGQKAFARKIGINYTTVRNWIDNNAIPRADHLKMLCDQTGYSADYFLGRDKQPKKISLENFLLVLADHPRWSDRLISDEPGKAKEPLDNYVPIPLLKDPVAAGHPREINENDLDGAAVIYREWCRNPENFTCARIGPTDDSMYPILAPNDIVAIEHSEEARKPSRNPKKPVMTAIREDGGVTIKWVFLRKRGKRNELICYPENKDRQDTTLIFVDEEIDNAIVGRIAWWWSKRG